MSECNYCSLIKYRREAKKKGLFVRVNKNPKVLNQAFEKTFGRGVEVHIIKRGDKPNAANRVAWFAELSNHCVC